MKLETRRLVRSRFSARAVCMILSGMVTGNVAFGDTNPDFTKPPIIGSVIADSTANPTKLTIIGLNFGPAAPAVALEGIPLNVLSTLPRWWLPNWERTLRPEVIC